MISNHPQFVEAIQERRKVLVRYYSRADSCVVDRTCAPLDYGPGTSGHEDGLNRYWFWEYSTSGLPHTHGLVPDQIVELKVLGECFDPAELGSAPWPWAIARGWEGRLQVPNS